MKYLLSITFSLILLFFSFGCKKGEGDPFLSLKSRKSRLVGEWTIDSWSYHMATNSVLNMVSTYSSLSTTYSYTSKYTGAQTYDLNIDKSIFKVSENTFSESSQSNSSYFYSENKKKYGTASGNATIEFSKDGVFTRKIEYSNANLNVNSAIVNAGSTNTYNFTALESKVETTSGTWEFLDGIDGEYKNKERVILHIKSIATTLKYADINGVETNSSENLSFKDADNNEIWLLTTLKNNEVIFEAESSNNSTSSKSDLEINSSNNTYQNETQNISGTGTIKGSLSK